MIKTAESVFYLAHFIHDAFFHVHQHCPCLQAFYADFSEPGLSLKA